MKFTYKFLIIIIIIFTFSMLFSCTSSSIGTDENLPNGLISDIFLLYDTDNTPTLNDKANDKLILLANESIDNINQYAIDNAMDIDDYSTNNIIQIIDDAEYLINKSNYENEIKKIHNITIYKIDLIVLEYDYNSTLEQIDEDYDYDINEQMNIINSYNYKPIYNGTQSQYDYEIKDLEKQRSQAYAEYMKTTNPYGVFAEKLANQGISWNSGYAIHLREQAKTEYENKSKSIDSQINTLTNKWYNKTKLNEAQNNYNLLIEDKHAAIEHINQVYQQHKSDIEIKILSLS